MKKISMYLMLSLTILIHGYSQDASRHFNVQIHSINNVEQNTDIIGAWHNEALDFTLMALSKETGLDRQSFTRKFNQYLVSFLKTKGIDVSVEFDGDYETFYKESEINLCADEKGISEKARNIACQIQQNYYELSNEKSDLETFVRKSEALRLEAETLPDENERKICGITASVSKHSAIFWEENFSKYFDIFKGLFSNPSGKNGYGPYDFFSQEGDFYKINWWSFAGSDLMGAWRWGRVGAAVAGGPAGAIACGLAGAAGHSCANLVGQAAVGH